MPIYFNENFKRLRKKADLTQEEVAEIFNISPQSVSRWETGANYPDIEILPYIAGFFKVTVDELLGTNEILDDKIVAKYFNDIHNLIDNGNIQDAINIIRKVMKEYPLNLDFQSQLLIMVCSETTDDEKFKDEIITISEKIIKSTDYKTSLPYRVQLIYYYKKWNMKNEARKLWETLPSEIYHTQDPLSGYVIEDKNWDKDQKKRIIKATEHLSELISGYLEKAELDILQKIELKKSNVEIRNLEDMMLNYINNKNFHLNERIDENIDIAELYCELGEVENAVDYVEKVTHDTILSAQKFKFKGKLEENDIYKRSKTRNICWIFWEDVFGKTKFDIIRNNERFIECIELLKINSKLIDCLELIENDE